MSTITDHLRQRIDEARREVEEAKVASQAARVREEAAINDLAAYERTLAAELRRNGSIATAVSTGITEPTVKRGIDLGFSSFRATTKTNKTAMAFDIVEAGEPNGVTAEDVQRGFEEKGMILNRNYVFNITSRLKGQKKIEQKGNRYFVKK